MSAPPPNRPQAVHHHIFGIVLLNPLLKIRKMATAELQVDLNPPLRILHPDLVALLAHTESDSSF